MNKKHQTRHIGNENTTSNEKYTASNTTYRRLIHSIRHDPRQGKYSIKQDLQTINTKYQTQHIHV